MPSVSAIILTKDSQRTIEQCIQALNPAVDTVIVLDTGSTDDTVQIAKSNGAYVYHFEWNDDFSATRNFGDSLATTDWVIHVDSDEILRSEDTDKIRKLCKKYDKPVVVSIEQINMIHGEPMAGLANRMYKRGTLVWRGIIHEQLYHKRGDKFYTIHSHAGFMHDGYNSNVTDTTAKYHRNIRLLKRGLVQEPDNASYHFFLGRDSNLIGQYEEALPHLRLSIELFEKQNLLGNLGPAHITLIKCLEALGDYKGAEEVANSMVGKFDGFPEGWYKAPTP